MAACGAGAVALLWVTHAADPGFLAAAPDKDPAVAALEAGVAPPGAAAAGYVRDARGVWTRAAPLPGWRGRAVARYCHSCNIWRPPRAHHCAECGACVERFDHQ